MNHSSSLASSPTSHPVSIVVAASLNGVIGKNNQLPWHVPCDLKHFKEVTKGGVVIMGRKTWESIGSKPLPSRKHIIISRQKDLVLPSGVELASGIEDAITKARVHVLPIHVLGGSQIYEEALQNDLIDLIILTRIGLTVEGDAYLPEINWSKFKLIKKEITTERLSSGDTQVEFEWYERVY